MFQRTVVYRTKPAVMVEPYQFVQGKVPQEALDQATYWRDRSGKLYVISEMNKKHAENAAKRLYQLFGLKALDSPLLKALLEKATY